MGIVRAILALLVLALGAMVGWDLVQGQVRQGRPADMDLPPFAVRAGPVRVVVLGTSLTARATWPDELGARLEACLGREVEVARVAKPGATSAWGVEQIGAVGALRPDVVIVEFAINDGDLLDGLSLARSEAGHAALIQALQGQGAGVLLLATNPVGRLAALKRPLLPAYQDIYPALAARLGAGLFDGEKRWRSANGWREGLVDGVHPDPAVEALLYAEPMAGLIGRAFGAVCGPQADP